jgi:hypothetical protein
MGEVTDDLTMLRHAVDDQARRHSEVRQLARDLLLTLVRRGDQQIDPAGIWQVAREFVAAGE